MFKLDTLIDVVALVAASKRQRAVLWQDASGNWLPLSSDDLVARVYALANAFRTWGILKGDRIAILCGESLGVASRRLRHPGARRRRCAHLSHPDRRADRRPAQ